VMAGIPGASAKSSRECHRGVIEEGVGEAVTEPHLPVPPGNGDSQIWPELIQLSVRFDLTTAPST